MRKAHLEEHPLCEDCRAEGLTVEATEVDHVDGDVQNNDPSNHRSQCKSHHSRKTARENGAFGRPRRGPRSSGDR